MNQSEQINELAAALSKAQSEIQGAKKDCANPFFKSKYADLSSVWDACREPLTKNGLSIIQTTFERDGGIYLFTTLAHSSGQWIRSELKVIVGKPDIQALGSSLTYCRRYSLAMIAGVCPEDDDGNAASAPSKTAAPQPNTDPKITTEQAMNLKKMMSGLPKDFVNGLLASLRAHPIFAHSIEAIPASKYEGIVTYITSRMEQKETQTNE